MMYYDTRLISKQDTKKSLDFNNFLKIILPHSVYSEESLMNNLL